MQSYKFSFFLDDDRLYWLEVEAETYTDTSDIPFQQVVEVNGVSFMGTASLHLSEIPKDVIKRIEEQANLKRPQIQYEEEWTEF